jgi:hypothetical protein
MQGSMLSVSLYICQVASTPDLIVYTSSKLEARDTPVDEACLCLKGKEKAICLFRLPLGRSIKLLALVSVWAKGSNYLKDKGAERWINRSLCAVVARTARRVVSSREVMAVVRRL